MYQPIEKRTQDFRIKEFLLKKGYPVNIIDSAIDKARNIPRVKAPKKVSKSKKSKGPVFAITYDTRLPPIGSIEAKHWRSMTAKAAI